MDPVTLAATPPSSPVESSIYDLELQRQVTYKPLSVSEKFPNTHTLAQAAAFPGFPVPPTSLVFSLLGGGVHTYTKGYGFAFEGRLAVPFFILETF